MIALLLLGMPHPRIRARDFMTTSMAFEDVLAGANIWLGLDWNAGQRCGHLSIENNVCSGNRQP